MFKHKKAIRHFFAISSLTAGGCLPIAATYAQTADAPAAAGTSDSLDVIIVTAERRAVDIQSTPISESAISGADLLDKHIDAISDLETQVPGLSVTNNGFTQNVNIRGLGNTTVSPAVTTGVPVFRDGLYQPEAILLTEPFYDIADVEVLRGPQGTLVGQNSTGGALVINSANPNFNGVNGYMEVLRGNYDDRQIEGAVNLPINDVLAARVAFNIEDRNSYFTNIGPILGDATAGLFSNAGNSPGSLDERNVRLGLLFKPNDQFQALFKAEINYLSTGGLAARPLPPCSICAANSSFYQYGYNGPSVYNGFQSLGAYQLDYNSPEQQIDRADRYSLELRYILPDGITLRSLSGYQYILEQRADDIDASAAPAGTGGSYELHTIGPDPYWSEEFDLISPDTGNLTWLAGASYFYRTTPVNLVQYPYGAEPEPGAADANLLVNIGTHVRLGGVFGQVSYQVLPTVQIQVGARMSDDFETTSGNIQVPGPGVFIDNTGAYHKAVPSGKVDINWTPVDGQFVYAFVARGFKDGGINNALTPNFKPEYVNDYEAGLKSEFFDRHIRTQIGGYYIQYNGLQQQILNPEGGGNFVTNLGNSKISGLEFSAQGRFGAWTSNIGAAYNHSTIGNTTAIASYEIPGTINTNLPQCAAGQAAGCNNYAPYTVSLGGEANPYSPTFQANASLSYQYTLTGDSSLSPRVDYSYTGKQYASIFQNTDFFLLSSRSLLDLYLTYSWKSWDVQAYAHNITNETYIAGVGGDNAPVNAFYGNPRTFGVSVRTKF